MNIKLKEGFKQVCIWPGMSMGDSEPVELEKMILEKFDVKIQYLEEIKTLPDTKDGKKVKDSGGRSDIFFAVHSDSVGKFTMPKLQIGVRWIEDVLAKCNYRCHIYPDYVYKYVTWNFDDIEFPKGIAYEA